MSNISKALSFQNNYNYSGDSCHDVNFRTKSAVKTITSPLCLAFVVIRVYPVRCFESGSCSVLVTNNHRA